MKNLGLLKYRIVLAIFVGLLVFSSSAAAQKTVKVTFQTGIYRDWDKSWMTTAPRDVIATITSSKGSVNKSPINNKGTVTFDNVPCNEQVKINIRFVGTAAYQSNSRNYTKRIPCGKPVVNLGKLEYGKW